MTVGSTIVNSRKISDTIELIHENDSQISHRLSSFRFHHKNLRTSPVGGTTNVSRHPTPDVFDTSKRPLNKEKNYNLYSHSVLGLRDEKFLMTIPHDEGRKKRADDDDNHPRKIIIIR
ncbi:hypothetical protein RUM44_006172 [Polyplax serrata]|uniref:Uncharacterized protein n=1 Tax=Polyplax serrata TaxID=468196 RepID=A0ABR1AZ56_POLSC